MTTELKAELDRLANGPLLSAIHKPPITHTAHGPAIDRAIEQRRLWLKKLRRWRADGKRGPMPEKPGTHKP